MKRLRFLAKPWRLSQSAFKRPSLLQTPRKGPYSNTSLPCSKRQCYPLKRKQSNLACVLCLLSSRSPSTVIGTIWAIVINTLQSICWARTLTNVIQKNLEVTPTFTDVNPACSVVFITNCFRINTATPHLFKHTVFTERCSSAEAMNNHMASTTDLFLQLRTTHNFLRPTTTLAQPPCTAPMFQTCPGKTENSQLSKSLPRKIFYAGRRQGCDTLVASHGAVSSEYGGVVRAPKRASTPSGLVISSQSIAVYDTKHLLFLATP